jgi:hypothetical protein
VCAVKSCSSAIRASVRTAVSDTAAAMFDCTSATAVAADVHRAVRLRDRARATGWRAVVADGVRLRAYSIDEIGAVLASG